MVVSSGFRLATLKRNTNRHGKYLKNLVPTSPIEKLAKEKGRVSPTTEVSENGPNGRALREKLAKLGKTLV